MGQWCGRRSPGLRVLLLAQVEAKPPIADDIICWPGQAPPSFSPNWVESMKNAKRKDASSIFNLHPDLVRQTVVVVIILATGASYLFWQVLWSHLLTPASHLPPPRGSPHPPPTPSIRAVGSSTLQHTHLCKMYNLPSVSLSPTILLYTSLLIPSSCITSPLSVPPLCQLPSCYRLNTLPTKHCTEYLTFTIS